MSQSISAYLLADHCPADSLSGSAVVVIDVLRASTTIVHALAAGAVEILPFLKVSEARARAAKLGPEALLCGERDGVRVDGFQLGNSPAEYTPQRVSGRRLVLTTTNGTRALQRAVAADSVCIGAFVNRAAVVRRLQQAEDVVLLCAGTRGEITREDALLAGALIAQLAECRDLRMGNDEALIARDAWSQIAREIGGSADRLALVLQESRGGRNVTRIGQGSDIALAARMDAFDLVPEFDSRQGRITANR